MKRFLMSMILFCLIATGCGQNAEPPIPQPPVSEKTVVSKASDLPIVIDSTKQIKYGPFLPAKKIPATPLVQGIIPKTLQIPAIQLSTLVEPVGVLQNGQMDVPKAFDRVGILAPWTRPGMKGNAVIAGHFDHYTGPAVFYNLRKLQPGDHIKVSDAAGKILTFQVNRVESFLADQAPIEKIFGDTDGSHLNLITCSGKFNKKKQEHARRLVVFSELVQ
ncbi:class F sortase [Brevibacillus choshinensis]|uniref:class F sortase n=1 Tax=Brevibacillus choshinensis TaxID=54911 RepID=UPI002E20BBD1|nr:class F sortase [Brevibacillus choshinensis]